MISLDLIGNNGSEDNLAAINEKLDENWKKGIYAQHPAFKSSQMLKSAGVESLRKPLIPIEIENERA